MIQESPFVSIIIPTFNRWDALSQTLDALADLDYPRALWEAIVVDDGSQEDIPGSVRRWLEKTGAPVRVLRQENAGPAAARNRGAATAKGPILIFIDNDIIAPPDFIRQHVQTLRENPDCWIVGRLKHPDQLRSTPFGRYRDRLFESFHHLHPPDRVSECAGMSTANLSLHKNEFERLGGFDESFTIASSEDWELAYRARQSGIRVLYHPQIVVLHNDWAVSLERFCHRHWLYSYSDVLLWRKYGDECAKAQLIRENSPLAPGRDAPRVALKKVFKRLLATRAGERLLVWQCRFWERAAPDSAISHRAYTMAVAVAIFRGVRDGLKNHQNISAQPASSQPASSPQPSQADHFLMPNTLKNVLKNVRDSQPFNRVATSALRACFRVTGVHPEFVSKYFCRIGLVQARLPNGRPLRFWNESADYMVSSIFWRGWNANEPETLNLFYRLARRSRVTLDVGAHVGLFSLVAAHANPLSGRVYAFDPLPTTFGQLKRNVRLNRLKNVHCISSAVGESVGTAEFFFTTAVPYPETSSLVSESTQEFIHSYTGGDLEKVVVPITTLDHFVAEHKLERVDLVKIDVEKAEPQVLRGMTGVLEKFKPHIICEVLQGSLTDELESVLAPRGYRYYLLTREGPQLCEHIEAQPGGCWEHRNYLFTTAPHEMVMRLQNRKKR